MYDQLDHAVPRYNDQVIYDTHYTYDDTFFESPYINQPDDYPVQHQLHTSISHHSPPTSRSSLISELQDRITYLETRLNEEIRVNETLRHQLQGNHSPLNAKSDVTKGSTTHPSQRYSVHENDGIRHYNDWNTTKPHGYFTESKDNKTEEFLNYLDTFQLEVKGMI